MQVARSEFYVVTLPNGMHLVAEHIHGVRSAAVHFLVPAGATTDPVGRDGACGILEGMLFRGAGSRDARQLSDALDALGLQRSGGPELEHIALGGALLADDLGLALTLYADILRRPHLADGQFPPERDLALMRLRRLDDNPMEKLFVELRRAYFPGPYGRSVYGAEESLAALTAAEVRADYGRRFHPEGTILGVAGRFEWETLSETVHRLFGDWQGQAPPPPSPEVEGRLRYRHIPHESAQEHIGVAYPAVPITAPDYYPGRMAVEVLSGGMSARLFTEVREKRGLCYAVRAVYQTVRGAGLVMAYAGSTPDRCHGTVEVLLRELERLQEGVTEEEVYRARTGLLSALIMQSEASRPRAQFIARDQYLLGQVRTIEEIREAVTAVTPDDIVDYLRRHPVGGFTIVTLGPRELEIA
ncbi:MAG: insulinase family protein [Armatimonadetes bacterium]|nr:insulinase family protein [Armatimonadota bacterium]